MIERAPEFGPCTPRVIPRRTAEELCSNQASGVAALREAYSRRAKTLGELSATVRRAEQAGYAAGLARALNDMASVRQQHHDNMHKLESGLTDILMTTLDKLLGDTPPEALVLGRLRAAIEDLDGTPEALVIEVHPDMSDVVQRWLDESRQSGEQHFAVSVREVEHARLLDCRLDLGDGTIDAGLATQMEALEQCFRQLDGQQ